MHAFARFAAVDEIEVEGSDAILTAAERRRRDRLVRPTDRAAYVAAHLLVRECAARLLGVPAAEVELRQRCAACGSEEHGAPTVVPSGGPVHVSLSHTSGHVAAIAAHVRCGIDVETVRPGRPPRGVLTGRESTWLSARPEPEVAAAFTQLWVRKEALVKTGMAALADAATLDVLAQDRPAARVRGVLLREWSDATAVGAYALDS